MTDFERNMIRQGLITDVIQDVVGDKMDRLCALCRHPNVDDIKPCDSCDGASEFQPSAELSGAIARVLDYDVREMPFSPPPIFPNSIFKDMGDYWQFLGKAISITFDFGTPVKDVKAPYDPVLGF